MKLFSIATIACLAASQSHADIHLDFLEGAPKDRFILTNQGACQIESALVKLDLSTSKAGLVFDVTANGSGVEVYQPFEITVGSEHILSVPEVADGDQSVILQIQDFGPGKVVAFTFDVDDTTGGREITVSDSEFMGVSVSATIGSTLVSTVFNERSNVRLDIADCMA